ncbi:hypothetical protein CEY15_09710 [Dietzia natronolimnaea]|uniref:Cell wall-binding repeat 2 family protein n=1 Tax=Dietzia natronolimnaea TaxID=161920 RepID=A0A2A2WPE3_9ACTN|nr:hypothetical protein [Dietzia natronolimnaea]PAY23068.1 hypothetical protein CEY15_09710 [Dietzia natronolimnaea]
MRHFNRGVGAAVLSFCLVAATSACTSGPDDAAPGITAAQVEGARVAVDTDESGVEATRLLVEAAPVVVVAAPDEAAQARAASVAVGLRAPMLTAVAGGDDALAGELDRMGTERVLRVGEVTFTPDDGEVVDSPEDRADLEELTGITFHSEQQIPGDRVDDVTVHQSPGSPSLMVVGQFTAGGETASDTQQFTVGGPAWSADDAPRVLVHDQTPVAAVATAVAGGAAVSHLRAPDPRVDGGSVEAVTDADTVIALGPGWGTEEELAERIDEARTVPELPGGGQLLFPGRRFVAAYGSPITPALGVLGEQGPEESAERVRRLVEEYQPYSPEPVIPAFEIIATVAATEPGPDGNYTNEWPPEEFEPLIDAITEAGGYAVIDLQPGMADLLDQARLFEDLLRRPNVGLALDPEWKLEPGQRPGAQIGSASAEEINRVTHWLADLTRDSGGPQKLLILHQFSLAMITDREDIDTSRPEVAISLHADGHGTPEMKMETWEVLQQGLSPDIWMAWKNFYDEDTPTFTPEQTMAVEPRPWFVSYQ